MSGRMALSVMAVSISVSPFLTLDTPTAMFMTSAPRRLPASSNEDWVRVEASKKRLIWVRPRNVARFFSTWREIATASSERSRSATISWRIRCSMPSRWRCAKTGCEVGAMAAPMGRPLEFCKGRPIRGAAEVLVEALPEHGGLASGAGEQGHRGAELQLIDNTKDLPSGSALDLERKPRAFQQPRPEHRMGEIGQGFVQRRDGEPNRRRALPESRDLRKDEPHPVALFPPCPKLLADFGVDGRLRLHEALQVKAVGHDRPRLASPSTRRSSPHAPFGKSAPRAPASTA